MGMRALTLFALIVVYPSALALAQPAQVEARAERLGERSARIITRWADSQSSSIRLVVGQGQSASTTTLVRGGGGPSTLTSGHSAWLVAYGIDVPGDPFRVRLVSSEGRVGPEFSVARPIARRDIPFATVATATPTGFTVLFQEVSAADPTAASTYMLRLGPDGRPLGPAVAIPIPWSLAAMVYNGAGYHLALIYPGSSASARPSMRLSMVAIDAAGRPQQHPDWASAAAMISDVHLIRIAGRISAFYRAGDQILQSDVTRIRSWGSEPPQARRHGALGPGQSIALRVDSTQVRVERD